MSVTVADSTSIFITWTAPAASSHNGIIRSYSVNIFSSESGEDFSFSTQATQLNTSVLSPYTTYSVKVAAVTIDSGPFSPLYNITTHQDGM